MDPLAGAWVGQATLEGVHIRETNWSAGRCRRWCSDCANEMWVQYWGNHCLREVSSGLQLWQAGQVRVATHVEQASSSELFSLQPEVR